MGTEGDTERLSRGLDPVSWRCLKAGPDFWEVSGRSPPAGAEQQSGSSGGEDTAKPEMMAKCERLVGVYIA